MEKYDFKKENIKFHNIVISVTSPVDYEMSRFVLLEDLADLQWHEYVIVEGYHCSCYGFDDTQWEAIKFTYDELIKICEDRINNYHSDSGYYFSNSREREFYHLVYDYLRGA